MTRTLSFSEWASGWTSRPSAIIGTHWRKREPAGDEWDEVIIRGVNEGNEVVEPVIGPVTHGIPISVDPVELATHYVRVRDDDDTGDPVAELDSRLAALAEA